MKNYKQTASDVLRLVGGEKNVVQVEHCSTRLRFTLADTSKADAAALKKTAGALFFQRAILQQSRIDQFAGKGPAVICVPGAWGPPWSASAGTCGLPCSAGGDGHTQGRWSAEG